MKLKYLFKIGLIGITLIAWSQDAVAQNQGTLEGTITEAETGEPLIGVNIIIRGSSLGASTNLDGEYTIRNIRPGEYNVEISYVGFEGKLFTGIVINVGEVTELSTELTPQVYDSEEELVVIGEAPIFDVEKSSSSTTVSREQIEAAPVRKIDDIVGLQAGVVKDATGIYIKGGRAYETGFVVDGVSAQDPLAGTGFGLDLGSNSYSSVEVTTGGVGAEYGDVTSGVVAVKTRDGSDTFEGGFTHKRDNFGTDNSRQSNFFNDIYELNFGGPEPITSYLLPAVNLDIPGDLYFFVTGQVSLSNEFTKISAEQVQSSILEESFFTPRQDNRWNGMMKLTYRIKSGMRLEGAYQRSLTSNQNTRMLQITGNDVQIRPGFQFPFQEDLNNANTYTHDSNLSYVKWTQTLTQRSFFDIQLSRLFTRLRADANGRDWRPELVDGEFDPRNVVTYPADEFEGTQGQGYSFILPGSGFYNNGGVATLWHDHFAEELVARGSFNQFFAERTNQLTVGFEFKFNDYQWIDIQRPWIGAPIEVAPGEFVEQNRVGAWFDAWRVKPRRGSIYITDKIRYQGLIADIGLRFEYWAPGKYVDDLIDNPDAPIFDRVREDYKDETINFLGLRYKTRLLPKIRVSFPVRENQVLFFNYGHSTRIPHPSYVYASLDPFYQNQSSIATLGNPNLNPEVDISYEIGMRNQITSNDALNVTAFWRDKYDFVTTRAVDINDQAGRDIRIPNFRINGDYARSRGVEVSYIKRLQDWAQGQISVTYSRAEGLSSTNNDNLEEDLGEQIETPLAWDRPWDIKGNITFTYDRPEPLFGLGPLNQMKLFLSGVWRSGIRYTPQVFAGFDNHPVTNEPTWRPEYESVINEDPSLRFSETGPAWFYMDMNFQKWIKLGETQLSAFVEISNLLNSKNVAIINPVTGEGYRTDYPTDSDALAQLRDDRSYDLPNNSRDPRYLGPGGGGIPSYLNPANYLQQRQIMFGLSVNF